MGAAIKSGNKMDMKKELNAKDAYFSYLLRIWCLENNEGSTSSAQNSWRVSLESTQTKKLIHFASLEDMLIFLKGQFVHIDETPDEV
jgi:hypothetical protein